MDLSKEEKLAKLKGLMKDLNKGQEDTVIDFASNQESWVVAETGVPIFDKFVGGFPYGHTSIVWGGSGAGKSSLMYSTIAKAQQDGKVVAFLDLENSYTNERANLFGVNTQELIVCHYKIAEQALDTVITLAREKAVDMIILDSLHSMAPQGEVEDKKGQKSLTADTMALLARKLSQFFRIASTIIYNANIAFIMIGQTRTDLGGFIALQKLSGGNSLIHSSVLTVYMRRGQKSNAPVLSWKEAYIDPDGKFHLLTKKEPVGFEVVAKIDKKKTNTGEPEGSEVSFPYYLETGFVAPDAQEEIIKIDATMSPEQQEEARQILVKKGYKQFESTSVDAVLVDTDNNCARVADQEAQEQVKDIPDGDEETPTKVVPEKKKRGRKPKNAS